MVEITARTTNNKININFSVLKGRNAQGRQWYNMIAKSDVFLALKKGANDGIHQSLQGNETLPQNSNKIQWSQVPL